MGIWICSSATFFSLATSCYQPIAAFDKTGMAGLNSLPTVLTANSRRSLYLLNPKRCDRKSPTGRISSPSLAKFKSGRYHKPKYPPQSKDLALKFVQRRCDRDHLLNVNTILDALGLEKYFEAIASAEDVERSKPDPQIFLVAASKLDVPATRCIVVEDAPAGVAAARRASMCSIGALSSQATLEADLTVHTLAELRDDAFDELLELKRKHLKD